MFRNCMTYALKIEDVDVNPNDLRLWYSSNPEEEIQEKCNLFHRSCRKISSPKDINSNEWLIAFFGFVPIHYDYEGLADRFDYHFMIWENGHWEHRQGIGKDISIVSQETINSFIAEGFPPQYFAIRKTES